MGMKKYVMTLALCIAAGVMLTLPVQADAKSTGKLSKNIKWSLNSDETVLTITGKGTVDIRKFRKEGRYKWPGSEAGQPAIFDKLVFGEGITTISSGFFCIEGIKTISLPKSFKKIKASNEMDAVNGSFEPYSTTLKKLQVSKKNKKFSVSKGILYSKDKKKLYIYPSGKTEKKFAIPSKVTKICRRAFYGNSIESVIMGNKLREIGRQAFAKTELKSVKLPKSLKIIEDSAFVSTQISSVELPKGLKRVGNHAFGNIKDLSTIIVRCNCKLNYVFADGGFQTNLQTHDRENYTDFRIVLGKELNATIYRLFADFADHIRLGKMKVEVEKGNKTYYIKDEAVYAKRGDRLKESFKKLNGKEQS